MMFPNVAVSASISEWKLPIVAGQEAPFTTKRHCSA